MASKPYFWWKYTAIIVAGLFTLGFIAYLMLSHDEDLEPGAQSWLAEWRKDTSRHNEAFYFVNGMRAVDDDDIHKLSAFKLSASEQVFNTFLSETDQTESEDPGHGIALMEIPADNDTEFCDLAEYKCYQKIADLESSRIALLLDKYQVLLDRYYHFFELEPYVSLYTPFVYSSWADLSVLKSGQRIYVLELLMQSKDSGCVGSYANAKQHLGELRYQLENAYTLIVKMVIARMIVDHLEVMAMLSLSGCRSESLAGYKIDYLTDSELSMEKPYRYEFINIYNTTKDFANQPNLLSEKYKTPIWFNKIIYKNNATLNLFYQYYKDSAALSVDIDYAGRGFLEDNAVKLGMIKSESLWPNPVGLVFFKTGASDYREFNLRVRLVNTKIALLNYLNGKDKSALANPDYPSLQPSYSIEKQQLCLLMPAYHEKREFQCVYVHEQHSDLLDDIPLEPMGLVTVEPG